MKKFFKHKFFFPILLVAIFFAGLTNIIISSGDTYAAEGKCIRHVFTTPTTQGGQGKTPNIQYIKFYGPWICTNIENDKITSEKVKVKSSEEANILTYKEAQIPTNAKKKVITSSNISSKRKEVLNTNLYIHDYQSSSNKKRRLSVAFADKVYSEKKAKDRLSIGKESPLFNEASYFVSWTEDTSWDDFKANIGKINSGGNSFTRGKVTYTFDSIEEKSEDEVDKEIEESGGNQVAGDDADACYSGAGVLGWVMCPLLKNFGELADSAYVNWIQPALMLEPELVDEDNGTFAGWQIFQNFANIAFIIMLLIVVLSQVTGVGLSNYGIKKTLPKLVIAVILINLSYIICQLAVDLSNVLGVGLKSLMDGLAEDVHQNMSINEVVFNEDFSTKVDYWDFGSTIASLALLGGIVAGVGTLLAQGMAVLLPLLLAAIAVIIGIMFFFILLSVRKAGVVLLVVLSPIAFVCYMLPNTKKLFDRWFKAFSGLLLLFPICGLIIGGGDFASSVLLNVNANGGQKVDFFFALTAMVVGIVPVFFIPMLLKNSMSALGNIGSKISGMGGRLSRGARSRTDSAIRNSNAFKGYQQYRQSNRDLNRARRIQSRLGSRNRSSLSNRQQDELLKAEEAINADNMQRARAAEGAYVVSPELATSRAQSAIEAQELKAYQDQFDGYSGSDLQQEVAQAGTWLKQRGGQQRAMALIGALEGRGMQKDVYDLLKNNNVSGMSGVMGQLASSSDRVLKAYGKKGAGQDYNSFMTGTGANSMSGYAANKGAEFVNGLDDKSLAEIQSFDNQGANIMSTDQLVQAAAQINSEDAIQEVNKMLSHRNDIDGKISGEQLVNLKKSSLNEIMTTTEGYYALEKAAKTVEGDQQLASKLSPEIKQQLNNTFRINIK